MYLIIKTERESTILQKVNGYYNAIEAMYEIAFDFINGKQGDKNENLIYEKGFFPRLGYFVERNPRKYIDMIKIKSRERDLGYVYNKYYTVHHFNLQIVRCNAIGQSCDCQLAEKKPFSSLANKCFELYDEHDDIIRELTAGLQRICEDNFVSESAGIIRE